MFVFPQLYEYIGLKEVTCQVFIDDKLYLLTTTVLTIVNSVLMALSWKITHLKNKYYNKC